MNKFKILLLLVVFACSACYADTLNAKNIPDKNDKVETVKSSLNTEEITFLDNLLNSVGFNKVDERTDEQKIRHLISSLIKYSNQQKMESLKTLYAEDFVNTDGFNKDTYFKLVQDSWNLYPKIKYTIIINKISVSGNYAQVDITEMAEGQTKGGIETIKEAGIIKSKSTSIYYLQKCGHDWLIKNDFTLTENTNLLYGDAKFVEMELHSPYSVSAKQKYTVTLNVDRPKNTFVLASLSNEPAVYPQREPKEIFRKVEQSGELERILTANSMNKNEYAVASVGLTKASINPDKTLDINVSGIAFLMSRVNVASKQLKVSGHEK